MADERVSQNLSKNPDPQEKPVSGDDITTSQEQPRLPEKLPQSLIEWLARINRRDLALSILCDVVGERPSGKQNYFIHFKAYPHPRDFKREFIARWEYGGGFEVEVLPTDEVMGLATYDGLVVSGLMILSRHRPALRFLRRNRRAFQCFPLAVFFTAMALTQTGEACAGSTPVTVDEKQPMPPEKREA